MKKTANNAAFEEIAYKWLRSIGIKVHKGFITRELKSHADYPALVSLIDFLDLGGMKYYALESERQYIPAFNYPLLAHIKEDTKDYMVQVNTMMDWDKNETLAKGWSGVVLFPDENPHWRHDENTRQLKQSRAFQVLSVIAGLLVFAVMGYLFRHQLHWTNIAWGLLCFAGLLVSMATIATTLGMQIKIVNEVCNSVSPRGCDAVLKSKYAKGIAGVSVADLAFTYFSAQWLFFVLSAWYPGLWYTIPAIAIPLLLVAVASLYTQKVLLKRWCALCLGIVAVLVMQGLLALGYFIAVYQVLAPVSILYFLIAQLLLCALLLPVKDLIKNMREQLAAAGELQQWKRDSALFIAQWQQLPYTDTTPWEKELQFGNRHAPLQITVACNPYCGPCAHAHETLHKLYQVYQDALNIKIRFTCTPAETDIRTTAVTAILRKAVANQEQVTPMLADWFKWMNLEKWQRKWPPDGDTAIADLLEKHAAWIAAAQIKGTPSIFINGRKLPPKYRLKDLFQLVPALASQAVVMQEHSALQQALLRE